MTTNTRLSPTDTDARTRISTLWIVVLFSMLFADLLNFITPGTLQGIVSGSALHVTPEALLIFAVLLEVPIAMVFLSRVLRPRANRLTNTIACVATTAFTIGGGTANLHYAFFATVEVASMALIVRYSWKSGSGEPGTGRD